MLFVIYMGKTKKEKIVKKQWAEEEEFDIDGEEQGYLDDIDDPEEPDMKKRSTQENVFTCRVCGYGFDDTTGQPILSLCDICAKDFDVEKIWEDINNNRISEEEINSFDIEKYKI
jgi:rubredoxin